jgi:hypothetical protein
MKEVEDEHNEQACVRNVEPLNVSMVLKPGNDQRRYNAPLHDEVAVVFVGNNGAPPTHRDIIIHPRNEPPKNMLYTSPHTDPMVYPILFPHGEPGWYVGMPHNENRTQVRNTVTLLQFYSYKLAARNCFSPIFWAGKLFQQYIVDSYVRTEAARLSYIKQNQSNLRVELYQGLMDHLQSQATENGLSPGRLVVLPSSFQGSPRCMQQNYQDAMAIVSTYGKPDLFITFTCNPKCPDIVQNLYPGQRAHDRPDVVARVFHRQLQELLKDILKKNVLGKVSAYVYVVEFQKRGLPHCHMLLILDDESKLREPADVDTVVSAEIPNPTTQPELAEVVKSTMIHGPCGILNPQSVCMADGMCAKQFPKEFQANTSMPNDGYPLYRRRDNGQTTQVGQHQVNNQWVVPYNPYLLLKYKAHVNVEVCSSIASVKYLYKYVYKGHDCALLEATSNELNHDEVKTFLDTRYVSAPEGFWRLSEYKMHGHSHSIIRLPVHLPQQQAVYFREGQHDAALERAASQDTMLTAFFKYNARHHTGVCYNEFPLRYVFDRRNKQWKPRKKKEKVIARMYTVSPKDIEKFCLRLLLLHVPGPSSYEDLRTVDGVLMDSMHAACLQLNLLTDDSEWDKTLVEAATFQMPAQLRTLFCTICTFCQPSNPLQLWTKHKEAMTEDFFHQCHDQDLSEQMALVHIQSLLQDFGFNNKDLGLPDASETDSYAGEIDVEAEQAIVDHNLSIFNSDQRAIFDAILQAQEAVVHGQAIKPRAFFLDGPGGSGKTTVYNTLISHFRSHGYKVASSAWTGIAATLLAGGQTCHTLFKLPVPIVETSVCHVKPNSKHAEFLRSVSMFIIDEASMVPCHALAAIDQMLQDITGVKEIFGGKIFLLGGDFRQVLPVVPKQPRAVVVEHCLKSSPLWHHFQTFRLTKNMRAEEQTDFADWVLAVGNGEVECAGENMPPCSVRIPDDCHPADDIVDAVFDDVSDPRSLSNTIILTPTNHSSLLLNNQVLEKIEGEETVYFSTDSAVTENPGEAENFPPEFLYSLTPSGMPPHELRVKLGAVVMLLRNLDIKRGLCNGTRLIVCRLHKRVIDAEILTGSQKGKRVLIPRIKLEPSDTKLPFILQRVQFPIRLSYSMTINKAQGQTFQKLGIFLDKPVFSHGQLYVALSRARCFDAIHIKIAQTNLQGIFSNSLITQNIVFKEVL